VTGVQTCALPIFTVWGVIEQLVHCGDKKVAELANCLWNRNKMKVLDVSLRFENRPEDQANAVKYLDEFMKNQQKLTIFKDHASFNLYSETNGEVSKAHKMVRVLEGNGHQNDIVNFDDTIINDQLIKGVTLTRYYFLSADDMGYAEKVMRGG